MRKQTSLAIASESPHTVNAGVQLAELGGNAVDIAVGSALAATVSEALMCSLCGSAFINIKTPGRPPVLIDGADGMPAIAQQRRHNSEQIWREVHLPYGDGISVNVGHASIAVPGMLRALELAWKLHGSLPWREVVTPAVELARSGTTANETLVKWLAIAGKAIFFPQRESRESFFPDGSNPLQKGDFHKTPHLDTSLELIAKEGADALYKGDIGRAMAREISANHGYVTLEDLGRYRAVIRKPVMLSSRGYQLAGNPPPAIGGAMVGSMIGMFDLQWCAGMHERDKALAVAQCQRAMFSLRHEEANAKWSAQRAGHILQRAWLRRYLEKRQSPNTMHMSVATGDGSVVAITMSNGYGSGISIPGTGIPCNNSLGEPELNPCGYFAIPPGGRLVSNMSPTVAWHADGTTLAMGSPGASRITTTIFQGWLQFAYNGLSLEEAVRAPPLHVEKIGNEFVAQYEAGIDAGALKEHFNLRPFPPQDMYFGALNIAGRDARGNLHALADSRRHGAQYVSAC
jgi:gamma-glutamyltranspeptidase / glutathione hydrolase